MRNFILVCMALILLSGYSANAGLLTTVVVPNSLENVGGGSPNLFPLDCAGVTSTQRFQQIYSANQIRFAGTITEFRFRLAQFQNPFGPFVFPNVQIDMSITNVSPQNASPTFADNLGPVVQTVRDGGLSVEAPLCTTDPCPFDVVIPLETPFDYNPNQGNLIIDWRINPCIALGNIGFDNPSPLETGMQRIFANNVDDTVGEVGQGALGPVTQFVIENAVIPASPVPTLSEWGLVATAGLLGIFGFIAIRRKAAA